MAATEIQVGIARIYGLDGADLAVGAAGTATSQTIDGADMEQNFDVERIKGQQGDVETIIASNESRTLTLNFAPNAATRALAIAEAAKFTGLGPLVKVTTSGFGIAAYNGDWNLMKWSVRGVKDGVAMFTLQLEAHINNRASLVAAPISG